MSRYHSEQMDVDVDRPRDRGPGYGRQRKGRGFDDSGPGQHAERDSKRDGVQPAPSIEGWCIFVTNVNEECSEDDLMDVFADFGIIKNIFMNLDRRTGFVKGYAIIEYEHYNEAAIAIERMDGQEAFGKNISVDWAFVKGKKSGPSRRKQGR